MRKLTAAEKQKMVAELTAGNVVRLDVQKLIRKAREAVRKGAPGSTLYLSGRAILRMYGEEAT